MTSAIIAPPDTPRTEALMTWVRRTETFRELVPAGAGLGWPAVTGAGNRLWLTAPLFAQRPAPGAGVELFAPFAAVTVAWDPPRVTAYRELESPDDTRVGTFPHPGLDDSERAYLALRRELFGRYDELCRALAADLEPPPAAAAELSRLLRILVEPGLELYYRELAPDFFARYLPPAQAPGPRPAQPPSVAAPDSSERLSALLREVRALVEASGSEAAAAGLAAIERRRRHARGVVACVGNAKSGRSTLINILLDEPAVPAEAGAGTAAAIRIVAGPQASLEAGGQTAVGADVPAALAALQSADGGPVGPREATLAMPSDWLREAGVELIDTPGIDTPGAAVVDQVVADADLLVMPVAALSPLDMVERAFIDDAGARGVPVLIVVTQLDRVEEGEREDVVDVIRRRSRRHESVAGVLVPAGLGQRPTTAELRAALEPLLTRESRRELRRHQVAVGLRLLCDDLTAIGAEREAAASMDADERRRRAQAARNELNATRRKWDRLALALERRRAGFAANAQSWLDGRRDEVERRLGFELAHAPDPRAWWEHDLPYRLRAELDATARDVDSSLAAAVDGDQRWLAAQVTELWDADAEFARVQLGERDSSGPAALPELELRNLDRIRTMTRLGSATGPVLGAAMIIALPVGILAGVLTAVSGEILHKRALAEQRDLVRQALGQVVNEVFGRLRDGTVERVFGAYGEALSQLRARHEAWLHDRVRAYERGPTAQADDAGSHLRAAAARLKDEMAIYGQGATRP